MTNQSNLICVSAFKPFLCWTMSKFTWGLIILVGALCTFNSCKFSEVRGNDNMVNQERLFGEFSEIEVSSGIDIKLKSGNENKALVKASDNLMDLIITKVKGEKLTIHFKPNVSVTNANVSITVFTNNPLEFVNVSSGAGIQVLDENAISTQNVEFEISSAGEVEAMVNTEQLKVSASSSGSAQLKGKATTLVATANSAGEILLDGLTAKMAELSASSGSDIKDVQVLNSIKADASSGANITYKGNAPEAKLNRSSGGEIKKI